MEDNRFMWNPKRYFVCTVCGCLMVTIAGAEIASARCHKESCQEIDAHHHPFEYPVTNNNYSDGVGLTMGTATISGDYVG